MFASCDSPTVRVTIPRRPFWLTRATGFDRDNWATGVSFLLVCCLLGLL
jgi:hypothetical protein